MDYNARYYSPVLGRFISPDTIVPEPTSSGGFNRYRYVRNNPLRYTDPSGNQECQNENWGDCLREREDPPVFSVRIAQMAEEKVHQLTEWTIQKTHEQFHQWEYSREIIDAYETVTAFKETILSTAPDAVVIGSSAGYVAPPSGQGPTKGLEIPLNFDEESFSEWEVSIFEYEGETYGLGGGVSADAYLGEFWNTPDNSYFSGDSRALEATVAVGSGIKAAVVWAPPLSPDRPFGIVVGIVGGVEVSVNLTDVQYTELWSTR